MCNVLNNLGVGVRAFYQITMQIMDQTNILRPLPYIRLLSQASFTAGSFEKIYILSFRCPSLAALQSIPMRDNGKINTKYLLGILQSIKLRGSDLRLPKAGLSDDNAIPLGQLYHVIRS